MKPSQLAKGFQTRRDTASSEKRTALDRLNVIENIVQNNTASTANPAHALPSNQVSSDMTPEVDMHASLTESAQYRTWRAANNYTPGQVIELPLKAIKPSPFNPRYFYVKSSITELAVNLASQGQLQAIHVIPDYDIPGTYFVSDGGRRVRALKEANQETVKAIVVDLSVGIQSYKLGYDLNVQRDSQTVFDNAVVWKRFLDEKYFSSQKELAEHLGLDESTIAVALSVAKLPEAVMQEMVKSPERFGSNMAYQVGRYYSAHGIDVTLRLIGKILAEDLSTRQVADIVKGRSNIKENAPPGKRQRYAQRRELKLNNVSVGDLKSYGDDRLELRLYGLTKEKRDEILSQIEQLFQAG